MQKLRSRVADKLDLVSWVRVAGWSAALPTLLLMSVDVVVPAGIALATGNLVAKVVIAHGAGGLTADTDDVVTALLILIGFLLAQHAVGSLSYPLRKHMVSRINGELRRRVRAFLTNPAGIAHLEEQSTRDDAHRVTRGVTGRTLGEGVEAQIATWLHMLGAATSAVVAATIAPELAVFVVASMLFMRVVLTRQISGYVGMSASLTGQVRRGKYWIDVAGSAPYAKEVRLFGLQTWAVDRQYDEAMRSRKPVFDGVDLFNRKQWKPFAIAAVGYGVPFVVLALRAVSGDLSAAELATIAPALGSIGMIGSPGFDSFFIEAALPCAASMRRLAQLPVDVTSPSGALALADTPTIRFENVTFCYPGSDLAVLDGLDLEIPAGRSFAIVGANGAGKTTLIKLLTRLYEPATGRITADGVDIADIPAAEWRRRVSVIFQDFVHYELSAADNVGAAELGRVDHGRLDAAVRDAGAEALIDELAHGWQSVVSRGYQHGSELSGGQWQRLALARLLYGLHAGRSTLVLDEPTANLDVEAEIEVFDRLLERARGKTLVLISHRFSTVRRADRIAVIDQGRLLEVGSHPELLAANGRYAEMFHQQADRYLSDDHKDSAEPDAETVGAE